MTAEPLSSTLLEYSGIELSPACCGSTPSAMMMPLGSASLLPLHPMTNVEADYRQQLKKSQILC